MPQKNAAKKSRATAFFVIYCVIGIICCGTKRHQESSLPRVKANYPVQANRSWSGKAPHVAKSALILSSITSKVAASFATAVIIPGQLAKSVVRGIGVLSLKKSFTVETP